MLLLNAEQREQARNRIVYILSCRGADGFIRLGQIHSTLTYRRSTAWRPGRRLWRRAQRKSRRPMARSPTMAQSQQRFPRSRPHEFDTGDAAEARRMMGILDELGDRAERRRSAESISTSPTIWAIRWRTNICAASTRRAHRRWLRPPHLPGSGGEGEILVPALRILSRWATLPAVFRYTDECYDRASIASARLRSSMWASRRALCSRRSGSWA